MSKYTVETDLHIGFRNVSAAAVARGIYALMQTGWTLGPSGRSHFIAELKMHDVAGRGWFKDVLWRRVTA